MLLLSLGVAVSACGGSVVGSIESGTGTGAETSIASTRMGTETSPITQTTRLPSSIRAPARSLESVRALPPTP